MQEDHFTKLYGPDAFENPNNFDANGNFVPQKVRDSDAEAATRRRGFRLGYQSFADTAIVSNDAAAARAYEEKRSRLESARRISDGTQDAAAAYDERNARLENAWKGKQKDNSDTAAPVHAKDAAQAQAQADGAWNEKKRRLQEAWRK
jgi:hypothetical protein